MIRERTKATWKVVVGCLLLTVFGCSQGDRPKLVPAVGIVLHNGVPLAGAKVFAFPDTGPTATGTTNAEGKFVLATNGRLGATTGTLVVTVSVPTSAGGIPAEFAGPNAQRSPPIIPEEYSSQATSPLIMKVALGRGETILEIQD